MSQKRKSIREVIGELDELKTLWQQKLEMDAAVLRAVAQGIQMTQRFAVLMQGVADGAIKPPSQEEVNILENALTDAQKASASAESATIKMQRLLIPWERRLASLPVGQRQFVEAHYRDGKSIKEIREELGVSSNEIHRIQQRSLNLLRELA